MASLVAPGRKKRRPNFSPEFKKALAQQACESSVSVSQLAQENGVNVNMLFKWRRYLLAGLFDAPAQPQAMLPVTIVEAPTLAAPVAKASLFHFVARFSEEACFQLPVCSSRRD